MQYFSPESTVPRRKRVAALHAPSQSRPPTPGRGGGWGCVRKIEQPSLSPVQSPRSVIPWLTCSTKLFAWRPFTPPRPCRPCSHGVGESRRGVLGDPSTEASEGGFIAKIIKEIIKPHIQTERREPYVIVVAGGKDRSPGCGALSQAKPARRVRVRAEKC